MIDLSESRILITGAAGGIGQAINLAVRECGATTIRWDVADAAGVSIVDVSVPSEVEAALTGLMAEDRFPNAVVNSAGVASRVDFLDITPDEWKRVLDINLNGAFYVSQIWARLSVRLGRGGSILNISSIAGEVCSPDTVHYACSKAGVTALTRGLAVALAQHSIRANAVAPGPIATELNRSTWSRREGLDRLLSRVLVRRLGQPKDVAGLAAFLLSPLASWITGSIFFIDGGILATR